MKNMNCHMKFVIYNNIFEKMQINIGQIVWKKR